MLNQKPKVVPREKAVSILKDTTKPIAMVRPFNEMQQESNLLGNIMASQSQTLKPQNSGKSPDKKTEVYTKPDENASPPKVISTTVSKHNHHQTTKGKTNDYSKVKSSSKRPIAPWPPVQVYKMPEVQAGLRTEGIVTKANSQEESYDDKVQRLSDISRQVKKYLKPMYVNDGVTKQQYKAIMKKCVTKLYDKSKSEAIHPHRVEKLVKAYVDYCKKL